MAVLNQQQRKIAIASCTDCSLRHHFLSDVGWKMHKKLISEQFIHFKTISWRSKKTMGNICSILKLVLMETKEIDMNMESKQQEEKYNMQAG